MDAHRITSIVYEYTDSPVPPRYHRSYAITVDRDSVRIVVDSYGEVLASGNYSTGTETFEEVCAALAEAGLSVGSERENDGCTGGTTETVTVRNAEGVVMEGWVYHCGGGDYGTLRGNAGHLAAAVKALIPDLEELLR
ncbi:MAG: hypothetical protein AVO35_08585 [Candidatus Aegiribacteria sp. MLS_C]|nr:MAG: hypothetical protein AVO35_08585 [Candidatus Aegiribacteria sp. MLS_C]